MSKAHADYRKKVTPKVQKVLEEIEKITKFSMSSDYDIADVKQIHDAIKSSATKMHKTLKDNVESNEVFTFENEASEKKAPTSPEIDA